MAILNCFYRIFPFIKIYYSLGNSLPYKLIPYSYVYCEWIPLICSYLAYITCNSNSNSSLKILHA